VGGNGDAANTVAAEGSGWMTRQEPERREHARHLTGRGERWPVAGMGQRIEQLVEVTGLTTRVSFDPASFLHSLLVEFGLGTKAERR